MICLPRYVNYLSIHGSNHIHGCLRILGYFSITSWQLNVMKGQSEAWIHHWLEYVAHMVFIRTKEIMIFLWFSKSGAHIESVLSPPGVAFVCCYSCSASYQQLQFPVISFVNYWIWLMQFIVLHVSMIPAIFEVRIIPPSLQLWRTEWKVKGVQELTCWHI